MSVKFVDYTPEVLEQVRKEAGRKVHRIAERVVRKAKRPPDLGGAPRDTGNLARSVSSEPLGSNSSRVFTETGYGAFVEFGTTHTKSNPFLTRAMTEVIEEAKKENWTDD